MSTYLLVCVFPIKVFIVNKQPIGFEQDQENLTNLKNNNLFHKNFNNDNMIKLIGTAFSDVTHVF